MFDGCKKYIKSNTAVIGIDEGQFFKDLPEFCSNMQMRGVSSYISALNGDSNRKEWPVVSQLIPLCTNIEFISHQQCKKCLKIIKWRAKAKSTPTPEKHICSDHCQPLEEGHAPIPENWSEEFDTLFAPCDDGKDNCDFCGEKITKDTFGLLTMDITCCNNTFCLVVVINKRII